LDSDWLYRKAAPALVAWVLARGGPVRNGAIARAERRLERFIAGVYRHHGPQGILARTWTTGSSVLWVVLLLGVYLVLYYI
jgi:multicomponent Na+:H+ antiporter subunit D